MPSRNRKKRCKQRAEYEKIFYHKRTRLKPESATRPTLKRRRPLYVTPTTQMLYLSVLLKGSDIKRTSKRTVLLKGSDIKRASRRTVLLKGSDIERASRRTVLLKGGYTGAIQLPLRQLEGVGIGRELPLPPKGMLYSMLYVAFKI